MQAEHRIYLVDVFAQSHYTGNPLAVIVSEKMPTQATMQKIAAEINFSETTFVAASADANGGHATRVFTPVREIAFTGHPILGSAWVLREYVTQKEQDWMYLNLELGQVEVSFDNNDAAALCWFTAPPIALEAIIEPELAAAALGLQAGDIDRRTPVQLVSAGTAAIIVPLHDLDALGRARLDLDRFAPLARAGYPPLVYSYCSQTRQTDNDLSARFFFEAGAVREDPATGNGAAFLGAYLLEYDDIEAPVLRLRIEQGFELGRPSLIHLCARQDSRGREIRIGGTVVANVIGELLGADNPD